MVAEHLTIRNVTSTPITLKRIERFRAPDRSLGVQTFAKNFTRVLTNTTRANAPVAAVNDDTKPFAEKEVDIHVAPFESVQTELR